MKLLAEEAVQIAENYLSKRLFGWQDKIISKYHSFSWGMFIALPVMRLLFVTGLEKAVASN